MKQEATKKSKWWLLLIIGLAALLAVAGLVVGGVLLLGQLGSEPDDGRPDLYWNLDRKVYLDPETSMSTREPAEDGTYYIRFAFDGEAVELPILDKQLVNYIDSMDVMGLVFDDDCVVDAIPVKEIATEIDSGSFVQRVEENAIHTNSSITMNGMKREIALTDMMEIYDVTSGSEKPGQPLTTADLNIMDKVAIYADLQGQITHVYVLSHVRSSKIYWRANQFASGGKTTRVPDENGVYTIPFFCEGERVELKCKNETEVSYVDKQSRYSAHFGLVFDEEGYIEEAILTYEAIQGVIRSERYDVTGIEGNTISTTKIIGSNIGTTDQFTITDDVMIYDVSPAAQAEGRQGKPVDSLQLGDRIVCFADSEGNPKVIYISERVVEEAIWCYNIERQYDSTLTETSRTPDSNGYYTFKVFAEGQVRYIKTKDKAVATEIDAVGAKVFGVTLDGDEILEVYTVYSVFGYGHAGQGRYITGVTGSIYTCFKTSAPYTAITGIMSPDCKVWNLSEVGTYGEETKLRYGDYIYAYQNPSLEVLQIFVMKRLVEHPIYYGTERKYNATTKETTRVPDADGWYIYEFSKDGKMYTFKTQSKAVASKVDAINPAAVALNVGSNGVIYDAYAAQLATGGYRRAHGYTVTKVNGRSVETQYKYADGTVHTRVLTLSDKCKTINVTPFYEKTFGEATKVRVGDVITAFTDIYDETVLLAVRNRKVDYLYWNQQKYYDDTNAVSLRKPDAEGWYVYTLSRSDGKVVTLKTQDKLIADKVDYYGGAFTLNVRDGIIYGVGSPSNAKNTTGASLLNYDVVKIDGNKVTLQYHAEGSSKDGEIQTITLNSKAKIFAVGPDAKKFGATVKLKVGDRIRAYASDKDSTYTYVYIRFHDSREEGVDGYCDVCKKAVYWTPWVGGSFATTGGHFYLPADTQTDYLPCSTGRSTLPTSQVCLDLNGNTYYRTTGRAMYVYANATLNIQDSAGGGMVTSGGINLGTSGGVLGIAGGTVNFYGGTLKLAEEHVDMLRGGVVFVGTNSQAGAVGEFNMYGGTITGGEVLGRGGNISVSGGILNIYDGVIENGNVVGGYSGEHGGGGNIVTMSNATVNMYGGTITGGTSYAAGGNVYSGTGVFNLYGGTIADGTAKTAAGGNLYALEKLNLYGGTVTGGESLAKSGGNIAVYKQNDYQGEFYAENCVIADGKGVGYGGNIYCEVGGTMDGVTLKGGSAKNGGSMYGSGKWTVKNCTFENGTATEGSGGNIFGSGDWQLENVTIADGTCTVNGGNISANGTWSLKNVTVTGGTSAVYGGNISTAGTWTMEDVTVTGGTSTDRGGNIHANGAKLTMLSGLVENGTSGDENSNGGGNIFVVGGATVEIAGGKITGGNSVNTAGNILVGTGTLKVTGGEITGGTAAEKAPGIYVYYNKSNLEVTGGHIDALTYTDAESFKISGNPTIDLLEVTGGKLVEFGTLETTAKIKVAADGVFTNELTNAADYIGPVESALADSKLYVEGNALAMGQGIKEAHCSVCNATVLWKKWNGIGANGHYYVDDAALTLEEATTIPAGSVLTLDLCGKTVEAKASAFMANGDLILLDTVGGGQIIGAGTERGGVIRLNGGTFDLYGGTLVYNAEAAGASHGGVLYLEGSATANLRGGTITGGKSLERGGNVYVNGASTVNLSGTTVTKGTSGTNNGNGGGNIFIIGGSVVNITGGKVTDGTSANTGGNILVGTGTLNISGGEITGGTAATKASNIYIYYNASNANITGGTMDSVTYTDAASFSISGAPVIQLLEIAGGKQVALGNLDSTADITVDATGVFTTANENAQSYVDNKNIKLADTTKLLTVEDNKIAVTELPVGAKIAPCAHCDGANATWYLFTGTASGGHYYLDGDYEQKSTYGISVAEGSEVVIDLAGNSILGDKVRAFDSYGNLTLMDSVGGGEVVTGGVNEKDTLGGVIRVRKGTFTLLSGTMRLAEDHSTTIKNGGVIYINSTGKAVIKGGTVKDGVTTERGGNIFLAGSGAELTVEGGLICDGIAGNGNSNGGGNIAVLSNSTVWIKGGTVSGGYSPRNAGNIVATGNLHISGGAVLGGKAVDNAQGIHVLNDSGDVTITGGTVDMLTATKPRSLTVSGKSVINKLELMNGQKVTLGTLEEGAKITVLANGVFTETNAAAEDYVKNGYIKAFDRYAITAENNQLSMAIAPVSYCEHCGKDATWAAWDGKATNGHYYLAEDLSVTARVDPPKGSTLVLDLNGKTFTNTSTKVFSLKGTLAILDCVGGGELVGSGVTGSSKMNGGVIYMENATFELYGGTLRHNYGTGIGYRGGVLYASGSTVNLKGGAIVGGKTSERGGNIYATGAATVINLSGTTIEGGHSGVDNTSSGGGNIFVTSSCSLNITGGKVIDGIADTCGGNLAVGTCNFTMSGGEISGGTAALGGDDLYIYYVDSKDPTTGSKADITGGKLASLTYMDAVSVKISGKPVIGNLEIVTAGKLITFGTLEAEADITIDADGAFAEANANTQSYVDSGVIKAAEGKKITTEAGQLTMSAVSLQKTFAKLFGLLAII